jgi:hypothetical protein
LAKVEGIDKDSIKPDTKSKVVSFNAKPGLDLEAKLSEFSDNEHLKGWSRLEN